MAIKKTSAASWLDNQTIGVAVKKLKNVRTLLWPTEKYLTVEGIEEAYANFSENASSFAHLWIDARRNIRNLFGSEAGVQEQRLRLSSAQPYIEYVPVLNVLALSLGALAPPLFYPDGTNAMMHGGLGYFYARELVGAIDREGVKVDPLGHIVPSWLSEAVKPRFRQRDQGCLHYNSSVFPEVPAMEVAFAAFQQHAENSDLQLTDELSEAKIFFITACLTSCATKEKNNLYGGDCNKAVMNFAPFAEAFRCPVGSRMNPVKQCTFFD
ncbi:neprilysin-3-like [Amblyomma americanum]